MECRQKNTGRKMLRQAETRQEKERKTVFINWELNHFQILKPAGLCGNES